MEVANAEVKLLEERLHATEKGALPFLLLQNCWRDVPNLPPGLRGCTTRTALKDIATQTDEVRKRMADKVCTAPAPPPQSAPTPRHALRMHGARTPATGMRCGP